MIATCMHLCDPMKIRIINDALQVLCTWRSTNIISKIYKQLASLLNLLVMS